MADKNFDRCDCHHKFAFSTICNDKKNGYVKLNLKNEVFLNIVYTAQIRTSICPPRTVIINSRFLQFATKKNMLQIRNVERKK